MSRSDADDRAIRAVVAAQWAVACAVFTRNDDRPDSREKWMVDCTASEIIAEHPTAEQIVDGDA